MKRLVNSFAAVSAVLFLILGTAGFADAQRRNERQIRDLVRTLNAQIDDFQFGVDNQLRGGSSRSQDIDEFHDTIRGLQTAVDDFEERLNNRSENRDDMHLIITAATDVDDLLIGNPMSRRIDTSWQNIRSTIASLAVNYGVTPDWSNRTSTQTITPHGQTRITTGMTNSARIIRDPGRPTSIPPTTIPSTRRAAAPSHGLTGTYQLDAGRSEKAADILSGSSVGSAERQDLESKLEAPDQIAIDVRGNQITLASSKAPPVSFIADGREKVENSNGRTVRVKATLRGDELIITSLGGETDYTVTFTAMDGGRSMKVTRRITTDYLSETVFAESFYNKTDPLAGLGIDSGPNTSDSSDTYSDNTGGYSSNDPNDGNNNNPSISPGRVGQFAVPSGTLLTGILESAIDTKTAQNNDRFMLKVVAPDQYRGATIEGYVTRIGRSGHVTGRSNVTFNFESITLRSGERFDFAGYLQSLRDHNGKTIRTDAEGTARGGSQTKQTVKRGGIGAGIGAVIGAIMGGGAGAAIGAAIGGGAGAGSVIVQGRDDLRLMKGSTMTIQSTSPKSDNSRFSDNDN